MRAVAIIAAYNEEGRIRPVIVGAKKFVDSVVVVDDGSTDRTVEVAKSVGAKVVRLMRNAGKGAALREGLGVVLALKPDVVVFLDADGQHDPNYIPEFLSKLKGDVKYVYGRRDLSNYPLNRKIGNWGLTFLANLFCPTGIKDVECGYRAVAADELKKLELKADRYAIEMDFAYFVCKNRLKTDSVDISVPTFHPKAAVVRGFRNFFWLLKRRFGLA
jgi:glycosyltransferase involved in cell wall biosynthesis